MKKWLLVAVAFLIFQKWDAISHYINPPPDFSALHDEPVVLYATSWCGYCQHMRTFLQENNVPFHEYDIERSAQGMQQFNALGGRGVPVMLVEGTLVKGYRPQRVAALLGLPGEG